jgi:hypothetical protein
VHVGVEVHVLQHLLGAEDGVQAQRPHLRGLPLAVRLAVLAEDLAGGRRQRDALVDARGVVAGVVGGTATRRDVAEARIHPRLGASHDVVRVDQRDDEREGRRRERVRPRQEARRLGGGEGVVVGIAASEHARRLVAAGVGREPALEPVALQVAPALHGERAARVLADVPLAAVLHVVAGGAEQPGHVLLGGMQRRLAGLHGLVAVPQTSVTPCSGGIHAGEDRGSAGRAHGRGAEGAPEGEAVPRQPLVVGQVLFGPARRPVPRKALLVGHEDDEIGAPRRRAGALRFACERRVGDAGDGRQPETGGERGGSSQEPPPAHAGLGPRSASGPSESPGSSGRSGGRAATVSSSRPAARSSRWRPW